MDTNFTWSCKKVLGGWCVTIKNDERGSAISTVMLNNTVDDLRAAVYELLDLMIVGF